MNNLRNRHRTYASLISADQGKIIGAVDKAIDTKHDKKNPNELKKALSCITDDAGQYFTVEESYMKIFKYPEYQYHKEEHQDFATKVSAYRKTILYSDPETANEVLTYLKNWLVKHFEGADKKSVEYFNKNGPNADK